MTDNENPSPEAMASLPPRLARRLHEVPARSRNLMLYGVIAVLVIAGLLLPPVSLFDRIFTPCGEFAVGGESASAQHSDGLTVRQASADQSYRLTLTSFGNAELASEAVDESLRAARDAVPVNLMLAGPVFRIELCGDAAQPAALSLAIPANARPVETLDVYAWNSASGDWRWIGSTLDRAAGAVMASVDALPDAVALMQTTSVSPVIGVEVAPGETLDDDIAEAATEVYPTGLVVSADGSLGGDRSGLPDAVGAAQAVYPVIRNYLTRGQPNPDLVRGVLDVAEARQAHINALADLAGGYAGVMLDYQGLVETDRAAYADFVSDLAAALRAQGRRLIVVLPEPSFTAEGLADTAGYDWDRIGQAADTVASPMQDAAIVAWATSHVNRYKLQPILSTMSVQSAGGSETPISFEQAIAPLGLVDAGDTLSLTADSLITFTLQSDLPISDFAYNPAAGAYTYAFTDKSGVARRVVVATAAALANRLTGVLPLHTRGVAVRGAAGYAAPKVGDVLRAYRQQSAPKVDAEVEITWQIQSGANKASSLAKPLSESWLAWRAPKEAGAYAVSASVAGVDLGSLEIVVSEGAPADEVAAVTAGLGSGGIAASIDGTPAGATADECFKAAYVADVTVPDGTHFDKGEDFTKTWKVRNTGTCDWDAGTEIAFVSGSQLGAPSTAEVGALETGEDIEISVPMKSGDKDGSFKGVWQLRNKEGFYGEILTVVVAAGEVTATPPSAGPVAPIGNIGSFEVGGHIDSLRRPDLMLYAGLKWIKIQTFAGADVSGAINNAHAQGFKILLGVLGDKTRVMDAGYQAEYAASVAAMAAAGADAIEVWNEPNINREWPTGQISGANYTALLARAYPAIKAANPGTLVISGAPAPTGFWGAAGCSPDGCNDDAFVAQMATAGAANYMDCVGAHHNSGTTSPSVSSGRPEGNHYSWYFLPTLNLYYNAFGGARKVCFTELGYLSGEGYPDLASTAPAFAWARNTTVAQQAQWLAEAASMSANSGKVRIMIIWNIDFTRYDSDPMAGYAIIRPGDACPACDVLRNVLGGR